MKVTSSCLYQLRRLRQICRPVSQELVAQLVHSFVLSRLDSWQLSTRRIAKVNYHAASTRSERSPAADSQSIRMNDHVTPVLKQLHRLPVDLRVNFKLCTMMHSIHNGQCPSYTLPTWFMPFPSTRRGPTYGPPTPPSIRSHHVAPRLASGRFHMLALSPGMLCLRHSTASKTLNCLERD